MADVWGSGVTETQTGSKYMADVWGSGVTETQTGSSTWQTSGGQGSLKHRQEVVHGSCLGPP